MTSQNESRLGAGGDDVAAICSTKRRAIIKTIAGVTCLVASESWATDAAGTHVDGAWKGPLVKGSGWLEWRLDVSGEARRPRNPFDADQVDIRVVFTAPDGKLVKATAFWVRETIGGSWVVRLLPHVAGRWTAMTTVRVAGDPALPLGEPFAFNVTTVPAKRRIIVNPKSPTYFAFDDGEPYVPIGLNMGWSTGNVEDDYRRWFSRLAAQGGNFARLWMASWSFGLEWSDTGLGNYSGRMDRADLLDQVLLLAERYGIRIMLCFLNHGAYSQSLNSEWSQNPYNTARGGPNGKPDAFVTDPRSRALFARRVRYIASRYAHSPAIHSWEWWNEINWTPISDDQVAPWIREMSLVLAEHDPYGRLRTTSGHEAGSKIWAMPEIDYMQDHAYTQADLNVFLKGRYTAFHEAVPNKPVLMGELGNETEAPDTRRPYNWDSVHLHNGIWASVMAGFAGTGMYWWWDLLIDKFDMWPAYKGIAGFVAALSKSGVVLAAHAPRNAEVTGAEASAMALGATQSAVLWVRADLHDVAALKDAFLDLTFEEQARPKWNPDWPKISAAQVRISGFQPKARVTNVTWIDTRTGERVDGPASGSVSEQGELMLVCPVFERDVAAIVALTPPAAASKR